MTRRVLTICAPGDGVCTGTLVVTAAHLTYQDDVPDAVEFIASRVEAAGGAGSGGSTGTSGGSSSVPSSSAGDSSSDSGSGFGSFFDFFSRSSSN